MSDELLKKLIEDAYNSGAQAITTTDIHCLQHITSYLNTLDIQLTPVHVVEIYASGL
jgi:Fe-S oxidoreductase